jgi:opacity protein-like surface antigen
MKMSLAALALSALLPAVASAAVPDYSYAEAAYSQVDSDITDGPVPLAGGQGFLLDGAYGFGEHWFAEGAYQNNSFHQYLTFPPPQKPPSTSVTLTLQDLRLGGGFRAAFTDSLDFIAHLDYARGRTRFAAEQFGVSQARTDNGYLAGLGLRYRATEALELDAGLDRDDLGLGNEIVTECTPKCAPVTEPRQSGSENVLWAAGHYDFGPLIGGIEYRHSSFHRWRELRVSLRMDF